MINKSINNKMKIINSNGFAEISNFVFSEIVSTKKFNSFDNYKDCIVLQKIKIQKLILFGI